MIEQLYTSFKCIFKSSRLAKDKLFSVGLFHSDPSKSAREKDDNKTISIK